MERNTGEPGIHCTRGFCDEEEEDRGGIGYSSSWMTMTGAVLCHDDGHFHRPDVQRVFSSNSKVAQNDQE